MSVASNAHGAVQHAQCSPCRMMLTAVLMASVLPFAGRPKLADSVGGCCEFRRPTTCGTQLISALPEPNWQVRTGLRKRPS